QSGQEGETDLMRLVVAIGEVSRTLELPPPPRPWLPTLPEALPLDAVPRPAGGQGVIGLLDDPAGQRQLPFGFHLEEDGTMLVFGASGAGKTMLLRTLAVSLAGALPPERLHVYALDFATRGLKPLEA